MQRHGWTLLFHECLVEQLRKLKAATARAESADPAGFEANANVKLFRALSQLILETVPSDPSREEYRQGKTMGPAYRQWRRAKIGRRFRLFFRYDSKAKVIVFAWGQSRLLGQSGQFSRWLHIAGRSRSRFDRGGTAALFRSGRPLP
jgi:toxin YhaV